MVIATWAKITIAVPPIAIYNALLAVESFSGAPWAVKNKRPVIIQKITTIAVATTIITLATLATIPTIVTFAAKTIFGKNKILNKTNNDDNFFFIVKNLKIKPTFHK